MKISIVLLAHNEEANIKDEIVKIHEKIINRLDEYRVYYHDLNHFLIVGWLQKTDDV